MNKVFDFFEEVGMYIKDYQRANFEDKVLVKITKDGRFIYEKYCEQIKKHCEKLVTISSKNDDYTELSLKKVAHIFGSEIIDGKSTLPIEKSFFINSYGKNIEMSLSDEILVKITRNGENTYNGHFEYFKQYNMEIPKINRVPNHFAKIKLSELFYIFGEDLCPKNESQPIEMEFYMKKSKMTIIERVNEIKDKIVKIIENRK